MSNVTGTESGSRKKFWYRYTSDSEKCSDRWCFALWKDLRVGVSVILDLDAEILYKNNNGYGLWSSGSEIIRLR